MFGSWGMGIEDIVEMVCDRFSTGKGVSVSFDLSWVHDGCGFVDCCLMTGWKYDMSEI